MNDDFKMTLVDRNEGSILIIDNTHSYEIYRKILFEVLNLIQTHTLETPEQLKTAFNTKTFLSNRKGLKLDQIFKNRSEFTYFENYLTPIQNVLFNLNDLPNTFKWLDNVNNDVTILGIYGEGDKYDTHYDKALYTGVYFLYDEKYFIGGDLFFDDLNITAKYKKNRLVLFPSWMKHSVSEVKYPRTNNIKYNEYRMSLTTLYTIEFDRD
ncbi:MAG: 2OG-Fe(II) oxygenase [Chitinophagaceae bacterium]